MVLVYSDIFNYVNSLCATYISENVATVADLIKPAAAALLSLYVILWGAASMRGLIQEPITDAAVRIFKIALICSIALQLGHYNPLIVDTFFNGPENFARALSGATSNATAMTGLDQILSDGFTAGDAFWEKGGIISGDFGMYLIAMVVWGVTIAVTAYVCFMLILAKIALSIVIALGPLFIISLLFQPTASFFTSWIHQLTNYGLLIILTTAASIFVVSLFQEASTGAAALTGSAQVDQIFPMIITGVISLLVIAQLPNVASGLAGGLSLSSYAMGRLGLSVMGNRASRFIPQKKDRQPRFEKKVLRDSSPRYIAYENRDQVNSIGQ